jgi:hypothetical protein
MKMNNSSIMHTLINLDTQENPKFINLGTCCIEIEKHIFIYFFTKYRHIFYWAYEDMKTYDTRIIQHVIPLKEGENTFQQKLSKVHQILDPLIQKELKKILDAKLIFKVHYSMWIANLVPMRKKSREIKLCVYFWNLNLKFDKEN